MALSDKIVGMHFRYPDFYEVGREKIREYAEAVKNEDRAFFEDEAAAELGYRRVAGAADVHLSVRLPSAICVLREREHRGHGHEDRAGQQVLKFVMPIKVGDRLYCDVYVHSVRQSFGTDIIVTKNLITNDARRIGSGDLHHACRSQ